MNVVMMVVFSFAMVTPVMSIEISSSNVDARTMQTLEELQKANQTEIKIVSKPVAAKYAVKSAVKKKLAAKKNAEKAAKVAATIETALKKQKEAGKLDQKEADKIDIEVEAVKKQLEIDSKKTPTVIEIMPPQVDMEKDKNAKEVNKVLAPKRGFKNFVSSLSPLELSITARLSGNRSEEAVNPEQGFGMESSNQTGMRLGFSVQVKYKQVGLEYVPFKSPDKLNLEFYGTSLGDLKIITGPAAIAKLFVVEELKYSLFFGVGIERFRVNGAFSIGGTEAIIEYKRIGMIYQVGGLYKMNQDLSFGLNYELSDFRLSNEFDGVPDQVLKRSGCLVVTVDYKLLKP